MRTGMPGIIDKGMFRYRLVALPAGEMAARLMGEKVSFSREYSEDAGYADAPSVLVTEFIARDEMEDTIIRWLQRIAGEQKSFEVTLNNYSGVPMHSVFIRIQDHEPFHALAIQLEPIDQYVRSNDCPPVRFIRQPNLPIAENLSGLLYEKAINEYSRRDFHGSFEVSELMRVRMGIGQQCPVKRAVLRLQPGNPVVITN